MKYSILHISDIHKGQDVEYGPLFQSMRRDYECYTNQEGLLPPSFVVVSGDLIQGAYNDDEIRQQYDNVSLFLSEICDFFLNGDRKKLIIVPGNHDVNRNVTKASMIPSTRDYDSCLNSFFSGAADIRWNWKEHKFYEVINRTIYNNRFDLFIEFYNKFYDGIRSSSNPQPIGFSGILLAKRQNSFYCTYFLHNRNVADTKSPYPIKRLEVIRWFNQKSMVFNQSLS